ncbi:alpha/beta hydrolase [Poriferisphaera sp. WC338]|uniref:alpha/beta hydrolase n=1 Tax=Poriferisphaera sp. WC338 TaxID=3425129 RepID=UPI003D812A80
MKPIHLAICLIALTFFSTSSLFAQDDIANIPSKKILIDKDKNQTYFLIGNPGTSEDAAPQPLLIIMPGGDGSADFHPFVKRIYKYAAPENYLAVQPVAPIWNEKQAKQVVWPTKGYRTKGMKFTTETFIDNIIQDVQSKYKIDTQRIFTLSWSSSGPAAYAIALREDTPVTGSFIAMSVFKSKKKQTRYAKNKTFYLYQGDKDRVTPYRYAVLAEKTLKKADANITLKTYKGGHGWMHANLWQNISDGINFLDKQANKKREESKEEETE